MASDARVSCSILGKQATATTEKVQIDRLRMLRDPNRIDEFHSDATLARSQGCANAQLTRSRIAIESLLRDQDPS
jgi:hypothetical protein